MGIYTATITFTYNNGNPIWDVDKEPLPVPYGNQNVVWKLGNGSTNGAIFNTDPPGIVMQGSWPGTPPERQNDRTYNSSDPNTGLSSAGTFKYTVNVKYNGTNYPWDPNVENEPPGPEPDKPKPRDKGKSKNKNRNRVATTKATSSKSPAKKRPAAKKKSAARKPTAAKRPAAKKKAPAKKSRPASRKSTASRKTSKKSNRKSSKKK